MPETASDISAEHKGRPEYQDYRSHKSPAQFYRRIRQFMYAVNLFSLQWSDLQLQPHFTGRSEAALSYSVLYRFSWKAHCLVYSMFYFLRACLETSRAQPKPCSSVVTQPPLWQMEEQLEEPRHCRSSSAGCTWVVCPHIFWGHFHRSCSDVLLQPVLENPSAHPSWRCCGGLSAGQAGEAGFPTCHYPKLRG